MYKHITLALFLVSTISTIINAQASLTSKTTQQIDQIFAEADIHTPGYMIGVVKEGQFLYQKGYGAAHLEHQIPITKTTAFNIASLSKQFTAAAIALLILDEKLTLEDPVQQYIPKLPYGEAMKIKHLVYMTSGINDYYYNERLNGTDWSSLNFFNIDTAIHTALANTELMYAPGTRWSYSNINYMLMTKVVEQVSGMAFAKFLKERLLMPLEMHNTLVNDDIFQIIPNRALGYNFRDEENTGWLKEYGYLSRDGEGFLQINRNAPHYGGSGMYTTMEDLKKWIDNFESQQFGGKAFYDLMHQTMKFEHDKANDAFGLVHGDWNGHPIVWYEGGDWGYSAYQLRFPKDKLTVLVFSNLGTGNARQVANQIMDILVDSGEVTLN
ncbi:MAG: serine hydrolase domain-containing protein [Bacteroidota bacterium]